jgi:serine/threonine protein kinase
MPLLEGGSIASVLKTLFPHGIHDEAVIATILRETLLGIHYFHSNNQIHRDVKAANIMLGRDGRICLGDFGVTAKLREGANARTFVGSICWMAPEVMDPDRNEGYDSKADIWSFGITALELARGLPPYHQHPPMKVIMLALNKEPPRCSTDEPFDSSFKEIVNLCLQKDPRHRPTAEVLLSKKFFKKARGPDYLVQALFSHLSPLEDRVQLAEHDSPVKPIENVESESGGWDFTPSGEQIKPGMSRAAGDDPLSAFAEDEDGFFSSIGFDEG